MPESPPSRLTHRFTHPYVLLTLTTLFWSGNMVLGRALRGDVPPLALAFWRWTIALLLALPLALPHLRAQWPQLRRGWLPVLLLGALGVGGYNTLAYIALQTTAATNALLLNSFIPVATLALSWGVLGKRLQGVETLGVLVSLAGVGCIVLRGDAATLTALAFNGGDLWMLAAVLVWALYTIGLQWRPAGVDPMLLFAAFAAVGIAALAPAYAWEIASGRAIRWSWQAGAGLAYVGVFPSFLGYLFYNRSVAAVGPGRASLFIHLMPVFGTLLSALLLGEIPAWYHYAGIALIFAGIGLTTAVRRRPSL